jgi:hypothetical protein
MVAEDIAGADDHRKRSNGFGRGGGGATIARISVRPAGGGATRTFNRN